MISRRTSLQWAVLARLVTLFAAALGVARWAWAIGNEPETIRSELVGATDKSDGDAADSEDKSNIYGLKFSPDGRKLVGGTGHGIYLWNLERRRGRIKLEGIQSSSGREFSPDGRTVYTWNFAHVPVTLDGLFTFGSPLTLSEFSVATGKLLKRQQFPYPPKKATPWKTDAFFSPARKEMVVTFAVSRNTPRKFDYTYVTVRHDVTKDKIIGEQIERGSPLLHLHFRSGLQGISSSLAPDEKAISYCIWDLEKNEAAISLGEVEFKDGMFGFSALSPCRKYFVAHTEHTHEFRKEWGRYQVWEIDTARKLGDFTVEREDIKFDLRALRHLLMTTHGLRLAMLHVGGVRAWDVASGKEDKLFRFDHKGVTSIAVSPDGGTICTAGSHEVRRWRLPMPEIAPQEH